jgi:long-chain acyl-CoA synthetase
MILESISEENKAEMESVNKIIINIFEQNFDRTFLRRAVDGLEFSFGSLIIVALELCKYYESLGVSRDSRLCLLMENSVELLLHYFVAMLGGFTIVPIDPQKGDIDIGYLVSLFPNDLLVCDTSKLQIIDTNRHGKIVTPPSFRIISHKKSTHIDNEIIDRLNKLDVTVPYLISFTSGSTGLPKGVINSLWNMYSAALAFGKEFQFDKENIFFHNLPMTYMAGILNQILQPFFCESSIVLGSRFNVQEAMRFWEQPLSNGVNTFWMTPTILSLLLKLDRRTELKKQFLNRNITCCVGTAPLYPETKKAFEEKYGISVYESYGLSELLFIATNSPFQKERLVGTVGLPIEGVDIKIVTDGEIFIRVPWRCLGFFNEKPPESDIEGFFPTGDLGEIRNGMIFITGRKKDLIIKGGINISPYAIENVIKEMNIFTEFCILGIKDFDLGEKIVCFVVTQHEEIIPSIRNKVNEKIKETLGISHRIDEFEVMTGLPYNLNGKLDKNNIRYKYLQNHS